MISWIKPVPLAASKAAHQDSEHWISVSDLMAGLMMVFMFIAVALMLQAQRQREQMRDVALAYQNTKVKIYNDLVAEFNNDVDGWDAVINDRTLAFEFRSPEVLFEEGSAALRSKFQTILADFFPRYMAAIQPYAADIDEVRIEGHTDSRWNRVTDPNMAYFLNMDLSQERTLEVLRYVYSLPRADQYRSQIRNQLSAVGMSSSKVRLLPDGSEDIEGSRRVSFRIITNAETKIEKILELQSGFGQP